jgi:phage FluMu protein Com
MIRNITPAPAAPAGACEDARCGCGSLLARVVDGAVELKCRRCKATWRVALSAGEPSHPEAGGPERETRSPAARRRRLAHGSDRDPT